MKGSVPCNSAPNVFSLWHFYKFAMKTDHAQSKLICHIARLEMLFWVLPYYNIYDICNYMPTDLLPQLVITTGAAGRSGVILVDSDEADCDLNNTLWCQTFYLP